FFNQTSTLDFYTLSLHDALPISGRSVCRSLFRFPPVPASLFPPFVFPSGSIILLIVEVGIRIVQVLPGYGRNWSAPFGQKCPISDRKSTRLNSSHVKSSYAVFCS